MAVAAVVTVAVGPRRSADSRRTSRRTERLACSNARRRSTRCPQPLEPPRQRQSRPEEFRNPCRTSLGQSYSRHSSRRGLACNVFLVSTFLDRTVATPAFRCPRTSPAQPGNDRHWLKRKRLDRRACHPCSCPHTDRPGGRHGADALQLALRKLSFKPHRRAIAANPPGDPVTFSDAVLARTLPDDNFVRPEIGLEDRAATGCVLHNPVVGLTA